MMIQPTFSIRSLTHGHVLNVLVGCGLICSVAVQAQTATQGSESTGRAMVITPRLTTSVTSTDNVELKAINKQADTYLQLSPGVRLASHAGRLRGTVDYSLNGYAYAKLSHKNNVQHALNAAVIAEVVDSWAYVDLNATVSQQVISAFDVQSIDPGLARGNQAQVSTYALSPYVKGHFPGDTGYEARLRLAGSHSSKAGASDSKNWLGLMRLYGSTGSSLLSWSADLTHQEDDFSGGRATGSDRVKLALSYAVNPQLKLGVSAGHERNDQATVDRQDGSTYGLTLDWRPTERTKISAEAEHRLFGQAHSLVFEHRTPRTVWRYSSTRDTLSGANRSTGSVLSAYDLYFTQFASIEPDPVKRQALVNSFLLANGISPSSTVGGGVLTSALSLQRRQEFSLGLIGVRSSVTLLATHTDSRRLDGASTAIDDLATFGALRQSAIGINFSHRLTPISSLNLSLSDQKTKGNGTGQSSTLRLINLNWSSKLGPQTAVSLGARHATSDSSTTPYDETAVTGSLSMQF